MAATSVVVPPTQLGVLSTSQEVKLQSFPVPSPGPGEVLIKNVVVAANPKDWKIPLIVPNYSAIEGNDVAGTIVKVGEGVTEYKGGERVAAFSKMKTSDNKYGAYQQYTVAPASTTFPIQESVTFEEAATLPLAVGTAVIGLFKSLGVPEQPTPGDQKGIIINGASSSVGAYVVQLAKRVGLFIVGVAGSSKDYATSLGADVIVDYRDHKGDALENALVKAAAGHPIQYAYDAVSENGSTLLLSRALAKTSPDGKGKITFILAPAEEELKQIPSGVTAERTAVLTAHGENEALASKFYRQIGQWLDKSASNPTPFQPNRVKVLPDGLESVGKGLELLRSGQVHGEKLVYRIADTPQLKEPGARI